jgi:hypothetical protein
VAVDRVARATRECFSARCDADEADRRGPVFLRDGCPAAEVRVARAPPPDALGVYPVLAGRVPDLSEVSGAYEIGVPDVEDLPEVAADLDRLRTAVDLLHRATLRVTPRGNGTAFTFDVGPDGGTSGQLGGSVTNRDGRRHLDLGWRPGTPSDEPTTRRVRDALLRVRNRLIVRYRSGHAYMHGDMVSSWIRSSPFAGWSWESFDASASAPKSRLATSPR